MGAIKSDISRGTLKDGDPLPSVRSLASDLKISALTVKKAYDQLEEDGLIATVHGKGSYVKASGASIIREEQLKILEGELELVYEKAKLFNVSKEELSEMLNIVMGD